MGLRAVEIDRYFLVVSGSIVDSGFIAAEIKDRRPSTCALRFGDVRSQNLSDGSSKKCRRGPRTCLDLVAFSKECGVTSCLKIFLDKFANF